MKMYSLTAYNLDNPLRWPSFSTYSVCPVAPSHPSLSAALHHITTVQTPGRLFWAIPLTPPSRSAPG